MLIKRETIMAKVETVYGTDSLPSSSTDSILVENVSFGHDKLRMVERNPVRRSLAPLQEVYGGRLLTLSFDVEIKGSGVAGTAPELGVLLRGCGMAETLNVGVDAVYEPASENLESITIHYYEDGIQNTLLGAVGSFSVNLEAGQPGMMTFNFTGHKGPRSDVPVPIPIYDSTIPPPYIDAAFSIGGFNAAIASLSLESGNAIAAVPSVSSEDGFGEIRITERNFTGSIDPEAVLRGTNDFFDDWESGDTMTLDTQTIGSTAGNRYSISANVYYKEIGQSDREGIRVYDIGFGCVENTGDDELFIRFS